MDRNIQSKDAARKYIRPLESMNLVGWLKADESERETFVCRSKSGRSTLTRIDNKRNSHDHGAQIKSENVPLWNRRSFLPPFSSGGVFTMLLFVIWTKHTSLGENQVVSTGQWNTFRVCRKYCPVSPSFSFFYEPRKIGRSRTEPDNCWSLVAGLRFNKSQVESVQDTCTYSLDNLFSQRGGKLCFVDTKLVPSACSRQHFSFPTFVHLNGDELQVSAIEFVSNLEQQLRFWKTRKSKTKSPLLFASFVASSSKCYPVECFPRFPLLRFFLNATKTERTSSDHLIPIRTL
jgi:hypothetical protein